MNTDNEKYIKEPAGMTRCGELVRGRALPVEAALFLAHAREVREEGEPADPVEVCWIGIVG